MSRLPLRRKFFSFEQKRWRARRLRTFSISGLPFCIFHIHLNRLFTALVFATYSGCILKMTRSPMILCLINWIIIFLRLFRPEWFRIFENREDYCPLQEESNRRATLKHFHSLYHSDRYLWWHPGTLVLPSLPISTGTLYLLQLHLSFKLLSFSLHSSTTSLMDHFIQELSFICLGVILVGERLSSHFGYRTSSY